MSWLYSQALVEEYLGASCSDGEPSVPSSGNPTQQAYCAPDKMTDFSRLSRYGMTYKPLMENRGEELLTLYLEAFHAKTSAQQEKEQELTENGQGCGEKWRASFTKYDPNSRLWKTHQCSLAGDLEPFSETWPQWGLMRGGECWEQLTLEQTTRGTESGLSQETWPTPDANCGKRGSQPDWTPTRKSGQHAQYTINQAVRDSGEKVGGKLNPTWVEWLMGWPLGWTDLKPLETDKSPCAPQQLGKS
jgi:hypothetical protein